jgi:hypothetical protein
VGHDRRLPGRGLPGSWGVPDRVSSHTDLIG